MQHDTSGRMLLTRRATHSRGYALGDWTRNVARAIHAKPTNSPWPGNLERDIEYQADASRIAGGG